MKDNVIATGTSEFKGYKVFYKKLDDDKEIEITNQKPINYYPTVIGHLYKYLDYLSFSQACCVLHNFKAYLESDECAEEFEFRKIDAYIKEYNIKVTHEIEKTNLTF